jgi:hypothetical protein
MSSTRSHYPGVAFGNVIMTYQRQLFNVQLVDFYGYCEYLLVDTLTPIEQGIRGIFSKRIACRYLLD